MSSESIERFDQSGLKAACERGLKMGRTRQEFDLQLLLDMFTRIETLENNAADHERIVKELDSQWREHETAMLASMAAQGKWIEQLQSAPSLSDAIKEVERLYDEWWDIERRTWLNVVLERLRALGAQVFRFRQPLAIDAV